MNVLLNYAGTFLRFRAVFNDFLDLVVALGYLDSLSTVSVFTRLYNPHVQLFIVHSVIVVVAELLPVYVAKTIFHMESNRQRVKAILVHCFVVRLHVDEQCLFIAKVVIVFNFIV